MHAYSTHETRLRAYGLLASLSVVFAWLANGAAEAVGLGPAWLVSSPAVAASFALLYRLTDTHAWRWDLLHKTGVIATPIIDGTYTGHLVSSYDPTRQIPIRLVVSQHWTRIFVKMEVTGTNTSRSKSVAACLNPQGNTEAHLTYTYKNAIQPAAADADMRDHDGTADLDFDITSGTVTGRYFNARGRQGDMRLTKT